MVEYEICDFGMSRTLPENKRDSSPIVCTRMYRAPEICLKQTYDQKADVFSLGCILYELMKIVLAQGIRD